MDNKEKFWKLFDDDMIVVVLLAMPVFLFLVIGYFDEKSVYLTMPILLYWLSIVFMLLSIHSMKRRIFRFFDRGPVFAGENPISFWILVAVEIIWALILFAVATVYLIDH